MFSATIYFFTKRKNPMLLLDNYEFRIKDRKGSRTLWACSRERAKCRVRIYSSGNTLLVKNFPHSHEPTYTKSTFLLRSQNVNVIYSSYRFKYYWDNRYIKMLIFLWFLDLNSPPFLFALNRKNVVKVSHLNREQLFQSHSCINI